MSLMLHCLSADSLRMSHVNYVLGYLCDPSLELQREEVVVTKLLLRNLVPIVKHSLCIGEISYLFTADSHVKVGD